MADDSSLTDPPTKPAPTLGYEPQADDGGLFIEWHGGGLTVIVSPGGWRGHWVPVIVLAKGVFALPLLFLFRTLGPLASSPGQVMIYGMVGAFWLLSVYLLGYACHFAGRRVRIDVDDRQVRRSILSPFGRWERAWDCRRVAEVVGSDELAAEDGVDGRGRSQLYHLLYLRTRDDRLWVLFDTPDPAQLAAAADAIREALTGVAGTTAARTRAR